MKGAAEAARLIRRGGVVAFPTDTVYGIGTAATSEKGISRLFRLKGRTAGKPLPVLIESLAEAEKLAAFDKKAHALAAAFWPGALTLVLTATPAGKMAARGARTIGLRVPKHDGLLKLLAETGPMASTSANKSGNPECLTAKAVRLEFPEKLDLIIDGGKAKGMASTVVSVAGGEIRLIREGRIPWAKVLKIYQDEKP